jgi:lipopolysaccharide transport system ATP-binding protein
MSKIVIKAENLGKSYIIGHEKRQHYTALRDVISNKVRQIASKTRQIFKGGQLIAGDELEEFWALKELNFEINQGDRVGIIGRNGAGKSTLLKVLSRITEPTTGRVTIRGRVASLLEVGTGFHPELTGRENIFLNGAILGMSRVEIKRKFDQIVDFSGAERFIDTPVKRYSSGMYVRLAFSVAAHLEPEILIVDEVLSVGDAEFQKKCLGKMEDVSNKDGRTILFVSHNMSAIQNLCNLCFNLQAGKIIFSGNTQDAIKNYLVLDKPNFDNKFIEYLQITQNEDEIIIRFRYKLDFEINQACLGFVFKDMTGVPIFGTNPLLSGHSTKLSKSSRTGEIIANIKEPKLADGTYRFSLWFGNGIEDFIIAEDCYEIEIQGMAKTFKTINTNANGHVVPLVSYSYN